MKLKGGGGGGGILVSHCPSVCQSVCGWNCVCSVSSIILAGFHIYLFILLSNFRRCVTCKVCKEFQNLNFGPFLNLLLWLCLALTWDPIWINCIGDYGAVGVFSEDKCSSCSSCFRVNFDYLCQARSKMPFKMWSFAIKLFSLLTLNMQNCFKDYNRGGGGEDGGGLTDHHPLGGNVGLAQCRVSHCPAPPQNPQWGAPSQEEARETVLAWDGRKTHGGGGWPTFRGIGTATCSVGGAAKCNGQSMVGWGEPAGLYPGGFHERLPHGLHPDVPPTQRAWTVEVKLPGWRGGVPVVVPLRLASHAAAREAGIPPPCHCHPGGRVVRGPHPPVSFLQVLKVLGPQIVGGCLPMTRGWAGEGPSSDPVICLATGVIVSVFNYWEAMPVIMELRG